jgi:hypothetical protein
MGVGGHVLFASPVDGVEQLVLGGKAVFPVELFGLFGGGAAAAPGRGWELVGQSRPEVPEKMESAVTTQ